MPHDTQIAPPAPRVTSDSPVLVEVTRGTIVECCHHGRAVIADARGRVAGYWGDFERPVYPRSAIKPLQALAIVESGAADAMAISDEELALSCASHLGEPVHTEAVERWLDRIGLSAGDLECGPHAPADAKAAEDLARRGVTPTAVHNNCSGKHAGMLATACHKGDPIKGYTDFTHPVQQRILGIVELMTGQDLGHAPRARDGCSVPTIAVSLGGLAVAMARMADPADLADRRIEAVLRVRRAWGGHPYMVGGRTRFDTALISGTNGRVLSKTGAEGVYCACLPELGLGIALKIDDGAGRASQVAMTALLRHVGALDGVGAEQVAAWTAPTLTNHRGFEIGEVRPAEGFPA